MFQYDELRLLLSDRNNLGDYIDKNFSSLWERGINELKVNKVEKLYVKYQEVKEGEVISNIIGDDGKRVVFNYSKQNKSDYSSIINAFSIDPNKTENIIGSQSHGKFYINREESIQLARDCAMHEETVYIKLKTLQHQVNVATTIEDVKAVEWS